MAVMRRLAIAGLAATVAGVGVVVVHGNGIGFGAAPAGSSPAHRSSPTASTATAGTPAAEGLRPVSKPDDTRTGAALSRPFTVNGIVVVSAKHKVNAGYQPKVTGPAKLVPQAAKAYDKLSGAIRKAGLRLSVVSSYRTYHQQQSLRAALLRAYGQGYVNRYVAKPGTSEHQTGLALDLRSPGGGGTNFDNTKEWRWLRSKAHKYGFVLRYPDGKTAITGIGFEPWHWRYVGVEQATAIRTLGANMTIEQYLRLA